MTTVTDNFNVERSAHNLRFGAKEGKDQILYVAQSNGRYELRVANRYHIIDRIEMAFCRVKPRDVSAADYDTFVRRTICYLGSNEIRAQQDIQELAQAKDGNARELRCRI